MDGVRAMEGAAVGTALGDALGLPREGLSPGVARALYGLPVEHAFWGSRGVGSDDTEHTVLTLRALARCEGDPERFGRLLAAELRWWLLTAPLGVGWGTLRALLRSWAGVKRPGVRSAGNGPAMRSAVIGVYCAVTARPLEPFVRASTEQTHTDERAVQGALVVARCAQLAAEGGVADDALMRRLLHDTLTHADWRPMLDAWDQAVNLRGSVETFARLAGLEEGVSGFIVHSVPAAIYAWYRHRDDPKRALRAIIAVGGDTDSTAAVAGALLGAQHGPDAFPRRWRDGYVDRPLSLTLVRATARASLGHGRLPRLSWVGLLLRNLALFPVVVSHVLRHVVGRAWFG